MSSAFIQAAVILLREGLEAMLVIAALAGYLTKAGAGHRVRALYGGSLAAVGASIIAAWLFAVLNSGQHSDVLEGIIILVAASLMAAAVHHHIGVLVCDGAQIYRRSRAGVPGAVDAAVHRTYKRRMAPRHRIES